MLRIKNVMTKNVEKVNINTTVQEIARIMTEKNVACVLVEQNDNLIGIITETEIVRKVVAQDTSPQEILTSKIMNYPVFTIDSEASIEAANELMDRHHIRHLAVLEKDALTGVVSENEIIHSVVLNNT